VKEVAIAALTLNSFTMTHALVFDPADYTLRLWSVVYLANDRLKPVLSLFVASAAQQTSLAWTQPDRHNQPLPVGRHYRAPIMVRDYSAD
jgi:hypothetical protein